MVDYLHDRKHVIDQRTAQSEHRLTGKITEIGTGNMSHLTPPSLGVIPCEYVDEPYIAKNYTVNELAVGEYGIMIICSFVLTQYRRVTYRQTDKNEEML